MRHFTGLAIVGLAAFFGGCGADAKIEGDGGAGGGGGGAGGGGGRGDAGTAPPVGPCQCQVVEAYPGSNINATLWMSLDCFCEAFGCGDYQATCEADPLNRTWERFDHPTCGLTVLRWTNTLIGGAHERVFGSTGAIVGGLHTGDTNFYCPSDSSLAGSNVRAGQFPPAECEARGCGGCAAPDPSCNAL